jgi:hypothetical protein
MHIDLESALQGILRHYYRDDLRRFLTEMSQCSRRLVATWGFPLVSCLPMVERLAASDFRLVWFDGDRDLALKAWRRGKGRPDDPDFQRQVAGPAHYARGASLRERQIAIDQQFRI